MAPETVHFFPVDAARVIDPLETAKGKLDLDFWEDKETVNFTSMACLPPRD